MDIALDILPDADDDICIFNNKKFNHKIISLNFFDGIREQISEYFG